jgi:YD repeat-containing protein
MLMVSSSSGQLQNGTAPSGAAANWTSTSYKMLVGSFGGSSVPVLYLQATTAGGMNYITSSVSGSSVTATASTMQIAATPAAPATGVGATAGKADVSPSGTGTYTIPLQLPRGHAGLTPQLALEYQHTGKNGLLGIGWSMTGLSVITRCPQTVAQDGIVNPVHYVVTDQYCLDGNRLRLTSGSQGTDSSQYRSELETYSLIIAHGSGTNGPIWFEVRRKDGLYYEYGNSPDSQVSGTAGTRVWALSAIRDRASNYITFSYFNDSKNPVAACQEQSSVGSYRPCQIHYSGNTSQSTAPPYTLQFNYQNSRNPGENLVHWYLGQSIAEFHRLQNIQLMYGGSVVHQWLLGYDTNVTMSHFSRLTSVQECGLNSDCFPATTFRWSNQQTTSTGLPAVSGTAVKDDAYSYAEYACNSPWSIDIDGDGAPDTLINNCVNTPTQGVYDLSLVLEWGTVKGQAGRSPITWANGSSTGGSTIQLGKNNWVPLGVVDLDGDGKQDFLFLAGSGTYWIHQRASDGAVVVEPTPQQLAPNGIVAFVDVDGDGFPDFITQNWQNPSQLYVTFHNRDGSPGYESTSSLAWTTPGGASLYQAQQPLLLAYNSQLSAIDVDGDGRQDLLVYTGSGGTYNWIILYSNGTGFTTGDILPGGVTAVDLNGDGCTDFVNPSTTWKFFLSKCGVTNGSGLNSAVDTAIPVANGGGSISVADVNGDGYQDLIYYSGTYGNASTQLIYSTGTSLSSPITVSSDPIQWSDRDGDGLVDQIYVGNSWGSTTGTYQSALGPKPDLMIFAQDGFGNTVSYAYAPINDPTVYTRGQGTAGKTRDLNGPMYVVKQLQSTDGVGGNYSLTYFYTNAHRNAQGRGFLGFGTRTITDSRTGLVIQESYNNNINADGTGWELVGTLAERKLLQSASGPTLQDTVNQWSSIAPDNATNRRYPYLGTSTLTSYELGHTDFPVSSQTTTTTIDNYGMPYDVVVTTTEGSGAGTTGLNQGSSRTQHTSTAVSQILNDTTNWCLSKPQFTTFSSSHTLAGGGSVSQTITQTWDAVHCRPTDKTLDAGSSWSQDVSYDYDGWGNIWHQTIKATNLPQSQRVTTFDYSTSPTPGQLLMTVTNALGQAKKYTWDAFRGLKLTETDPNGFVTSWEYDDFGRMKHEVRPDHTGLRRTYSACNANTNYCGDSLLRYMVQEDERDVNDNIITYSYKFYDSLRRVKYDETLGYSGALSVVETMYDSRGNVASKSMPYYAGTDTVKGTSFAYDLYNRVVSSEQPTSDSDPTPATTTTVYTGLTVTVSDPLGKARTQVSNAWGDVIQVTDEGGNTTSYTYDGFSNLASTKDANGNQSTYTYTDRGFRLSSSDPDMGTWTYAYDGAGELLSQTDAKSQTTQYHYDALGRMDNRTDPGASAPDTHWNWDTVSNGIGQLGSVTGILGYAESYVMTAQAAR